MNCSSERKGPDIFRQEYLGNIRLKECYVQDNDNNHCPDNPVHFFEHNGNKVGLCERCYQNYLSGGFGERPNNTLIEMKEYTTETWYDRNTRSWITQIFKNGKQFGDAKYAGCKSERDFNKAEAQKFIAKQNKI